MPDTEGLGEERWTIHIAEDGSVSEQDQSWTIPVEVVPASRVDELSAENERYREALEFYADPNTYFAIGLFPDSPCGEFIEDFDDQFPDKPGAKARAALHPTEETDEEARS